tara:strand:- start:211 stop:558 length:348 start_codon:yes stop_codon:yes gene_type:complete
MAPTVVFDENGHPLLAIGSPGGSRIICYVAKSLIGVIDWGLDLDQAVSHANLCNRNGPSELEAGSQMVDFQAPLEKLGHNVVIRQMNSGVHAVMAADAGLVGAADPRREGAVKGH